MREGMWRRTVAALVPALLAAFTLWLAVTGSWSLVGVPGVGLSFADLTAVTANAECLRSGQSVVADCDPLGRPFNYPTLWIRVFAILGLGVSATEPVGIALIVIFAVSLGALAFLVLPARVRAGEAAVLAAMVFAPPTFLLLERGNIDIVVFALLTCAYWAWVSLRFVAAAAVMGVGFMLKVFPLGAGLLFFVHPVRRRAAVVYGGVLALGLLLVGRELTTISARTPVSCGGSFGATVPARCLADLTDATSSAGWLRVGGLALFVVVTALTLLAARINGPLGAGLDRLGKALYADPIATTVFTAGSGVFLMAYVAGTNWDYRLVFLIPPGLALLRVVRQTRLAAIPLAVIVAQMWISYRVPRGLEALGDLVWIVLAPALLVLCLAVIRASRRDGRVTPAAFGYSIT